VLPNQHGYANLLDNDEEYSKEYDDRRSASVSTGDGVRLTPLASAINSKYVDDV
jgi:hypothetical protein